MEPAGLRVGAGRAPLSPPRRVTSHASAAAKQRGEPGGLSQGKARRDGWGPRAPRRRGARGRDSLAAVGPRGGL